MNFDDRRGFLYKFFCILGILFSPLMLAIYLAIGTSVYFGYQDYSRKHHFVRPRVIENITGVRMPKYKVIERNLERAIDYEDTFVLEFKEMPDSSFYQHLRNNGFDYYDGCYHFQLNWGSGLVKDEVVPKGEKGNYDYTMTICEGEKTFTVRVMEL